jgi:hypothetical protein
VRNNKAKRKILVTVKNSVDDFIKEYSERGNEVAFARFKTTSKKGEVLYVLLSQSEGGKGVH